MRRALRSVIGVVGFISFVGMLRERAERLEFTSAGLLYSTQDRAPDLGILKEPQFWGRDCHLRIEHDLPATDFLDMCLAPFGMIKR